VKRILKLNDEITTFSIKSATDVMIFKNIFDKKFSEKIGVLTQNKAKLCTNLIITLVFEKNANFFAENCRKSQKIVIITSTPGANPTTSEFTTSTSTPSLH
jgi:hypothetical protein